MALLTGYYPNRLGWERGVVGHLMPTSTGLSPSVTTLAEVFKEAGYETALIGEWHLGDAASFRPHQQGFQHTYYLNKSNNQTRKVWRGDEVVEDPFDNQPSHRAVLLRKPKPLFTSKPTHLFCSIFL